MTRAMFDNRWPPAYNPVFPTSSGVYPYSSEIVAVQAAKKDCGCGCRGKGACGGQALAGLGDCGCGGGVAKDGAFLAGLAAGGLSQATEGSQLTSGQRMFIGTISLVASGLSAYHGYRRSESIGWAVVWGLSGALFPIITPAVAVAQGFGEPA